MVVETVRLTRFNIKKFRLSAGNVIGGEVQECFVTNNPNVNLFLHLKMYFALDPKF